MHSHLNKIVIMNSFKKPDKKNNIEEDSIKNRSLTLFRRSCFAGVCISLGGTVYLTIGGIIGAVLFSFGLLAVIHYELPLYTGKCGFIKTKEDFVRIPLILLGNITGTFFTALFIKCAKPNLVNASNTIIEQRLGLSLLQSLFLSMFCGIIMTIVVKYAKKKKFLPLLIGIPLFIVCGFIHSIADAFYYSLASFNLIIDNWVDCVLIYLFAVIGNFIGCILPNEFNSGCFLYTDE